MVVTVPPLFLIPPAVPQVPTAVVLPVLLGRAVALSFLFPHATLLAGPCALPVTTTVAPLPRAETKLCAVLVSLLIVAAGPAPLVSGDTACGVPPNKISARRIVLETVAVVVVAVP